MRCRMPSAQRMLCKAWLYLQLHGYMTHRRTAMKAELLTRVPPRAQRKATTPSRHAAAQDAALTTLQPLAKAAGQSLPAAQLQKMQHIADQYVGAQDAALATLQPLAKAARQSSQAAQLQKMQHIAGQYVGALPTLQRNQTGLPDGLKAGVENLSGMSLDKVRVHYNSSKPAQLNAHAYAQGADIHVAPGQQKHLAHEAWHVVQQAQGRVRPTTQLKNGAPTNDDPALDREADSMGSKAMQMKTVTPAQQLSQPSLRAHTLTQQLAKYGDSAKLARERYKSKSKKSKHTFARWKKGREAQHLIPAQVCKEFGIPTAWANSAVNGMMMPSGRTSTNHQRLTSLDKGKRIHIKGGGAHPNYNKAIFAMAIKAPFKWKKGAVSRPKFEALANHLRTLNRPRRSGSARDYVDDIR